MVVVELEHTSDLYLRAEAESFEKALEELIKYVGKFLGKAEEEEYIEFFVDGSREEVVVKTFEEILYMVDAFSFIPTRAEVRKKDDGYLIRIYFGKGKKENEIKAVTWHGLKVEEKDGKCIVEVLFDL